MGKGPQLFHNSGSDAMILPELHPSIVTYAFPMGFYNPQDIRELDLPKGRYTYP